MIKSKIVHGGLKNSILKYWWVLYGLLILIHLAITPYFPLPWFDETYFASISSGYGNNGTLIPEIAYIAKNSKPAVSYGPLYFQITSFLCERIGYSPFSFRIINLLFGLAIPITIFLVFKKSKGFTSFTIGLLLLLDPFYGYCIHSGRMDAMALFLTLPFAYQCYLLFKNGSVNLITWLLTIICFVLALLTTPRVTIIVLPALSFFPLIFLVLKQWTVVKYWMIALFVIGGLYTIWIYSEFDNFSSFFNYYSKVQKGNTTAIHGFLGINFYIPKTMVLLLICTIAIVLINFKLYKLLPHRAFVITIPFFYYIIIYDWGMYSIFIIPALYFMILLYESNTKKYKNLILILLCFNSLLFSLRVIENIFSLTNRDPKIAQNFILKNIPKNAKVIGSNCYYYALRNNNNTFQIIDKYNTEEHRHELFSNEFDYDYIILSKQEYDREKNLYSPYLVNCSFVDSLIIHPHKIQNIIYESRLISSTEKWGYSGYIYKRNK